MNSVLLVRILLGIIAVSILILLFKLHRAIKLDRRISRYSLKMNTVEELSYFDKLGEKYKKFIRKCRNNKRLVEYSKNYEKYTQIGDGTFAIQFVINKLIIALSFVGLVIISCAIRGKLIGFIGFVLSFIIGYYVYDIYLIISKKLRCTKIKNEMLRAVIIMNNAFKAGKSTLQAVNIASHDLPNPIAKEFEKIHQDMSFGLSVDVAFSRFAKRVNLEEANYMASVLTILNKTGGNIINVFSSIEKVLFDKKKLEEDLKNSSAAAKFMVIILMIIPIAFVVVICDKHFLGNPEYFDPLFASAIGYFVLVIILMMYVIYVYLLLKVLKVKV